MIAGDGGGEETCNSIATESERISVIRWEAPIGKRGTTYWLKTWMQELSPFDRTVFVDADVLCVDKGIEKLFPDNPYSTTLTSWCDWNSHGKRIRKRCLVYEDIHPRQVARMVYGQRHYPAINTGTLGFTKDSLFMRDWKEITKQRIRFICDEMIAQIFYPDYPHTIKDHRWNCSPIYAGETKNPIILHGHGKKFIKRAAGRKIWLPHFEAAYAENFGGIRELVKHDGKLWNAEAGRPCTDAELAERFDK
jgi:hypothetical protein